LYFDIIIVFTVHSAKLISVECSDEFVWFWLNANQTDPITRKHWCIKCFIHFSSKKDRNRHINAIPEVCFLFVSLKKSEYLISTTVCWSQPSISVMVDSSWDIECDHLICHTPNQSLIDDQSSLLRFAGLSHLFQLW
jgi:hypothetical protein